jgi:hypothetical protein
MTLSVHHRASQEEEAMKFANNPAQARTAVDILNAIANCCS